VGKTDLYRANVPVPGNGSFVNATKDWFTRRDMIVMYGGEACDQQIPTVADHTAIMAGISNGIFPLKSETGVAINNRTFYYGFSNVMNQGVLIGRDGTPAAPAGCYYILIYNVATKPSDYSLFFSTAPR